MAGIGATNVSYRSESYFSLFLFPGCRLNWSAKVRADGRSR